MRMMQEPAEGGRGIARLVLLEESFTMRLDFRAGNLLLWMERVIGLWKRLSDE
jgi:hypothetical protein